jgi:hypothetical protein
MELMESNQRQQALADENNQLKANMRNMRLQVEKLEKLKKGFLETLDLHNLDPENQNHHHHQQQQQYNANPLNPPSIERVSDALVFHGLFCA